MRGSRLKRRRFRVFAEACEVTRPVRLASIAITVVAVAMAMKGWQVGTGVLGGALVLVAALTVYQVHRGVNQLHRRSDMIREAAEQAEDHYVQVLWRIVRVVESRDKYTEGHSERVADLTEQIARTMNLPPETCTKLQTAARLHDLGMLAVSQKILSERERLGAETFHTIELHPEIAHEILRPLGSLREVLPAIRHHHERMNGTGYPSGLKGDGIPIEARILAVADAYDAMTHDRPHRSAMSPIYAVTELRRCTPAGYDPACVEALAQLKNLPEPSLTPAYV